MYRSCEIWDFLASFLFRRNVMGSLCSLEYVGQWQNRGTAMKRQHAAWCQSELPIHLHDVRWVKYHLGLDVNMRSFLSRLSLRMWSRQSRHQNREITHEYIHRSLNVFGRQIDPLMIS